MQEEGKSPHAKSTFPTYCDLVMVSGECRLFESFPARESCNTKKSILRIGCCTRSVLSISMSGQKMATDGCEPLWHEGCVVCQRRRALLLIGNQAYSWD